MILIAPPADCVDDISKNYVLGLRVYLSKKAAEKELVSLRLKGFYAFIDELVIDIESVENNGKKDKLSKYYYLCVGFNSKSDAQFSYRQLKKIYPDATMLKGDPPDLNELP